MRYVPHGPPSAAGTPLLGQLAARLLDCGAAEPPTEAPVLRRRAVRTEASRMRFGRRLRMCGSDPDFAPGGVLVFPPVGLPCNGRFGASTRKARSSDHRRWRPSSSAAGHVVAGSVGEPVLSYRDGERAPGVRRRMAAQPGFPGHGGCGEASRHSQGSAPGPPAQSFVRVNGALEVAGPGHRRARRRQGPAACAAGPLPTPGGEGPVPVDEGHRAGVAGPLGAALSGVARWGASRQRTSTQSPDEVTDGVVEVPAKV